MLKNLIMYHTADFLFHYGITITCTGYTFGEKGFWGFVLWVLDKVYKTKCLPGTN